MIIDPRALNRANRAPPLGQARLHSIVEAISGTAIGFALSWALLALVISPLFNLRTDASEDLLITAMFTILSVLRSYGVRRLFNWWHCRG